MPAEVLPLVIKEWKPHKKQEEFLRLPSSIFAGFYGGAAGGGKSDVLLMLPILKEWYKNGNFHGIMFRRTFPELEESLILSSRRGIGKNGPSYRDFGGHYNPTEHAWTFPSGAVLRFRYAKQEADVEQHDTAQFNYLAMDELTHFTSYQFSYLTHRVRTIDPSLPPIVRCASNPGNIGHTWVREMFIDPAPGGRSIIEAVAKDGTITKRIFIPARLTDNPYLLKNDPEYYARLNMLPEAERRAKMLGDWDAFSGQVFSEFRSLYHPDEPENAIHVIPPFQIPLWWPRLLALDWGYRAMTYALWLAIAPTARVYAYREHVAVKTDIDVWAADLRRLSQEENDSIVLKVVDPSSTRKLGLPKTIKEQIESASGWQFELADNDRIGGKMLIHKHLRFTPRPPRFVPKEGFNEEIAAKIFRLYGQKAVDDYKTAYAPDVPEDNIPLLQIFDDSHHGLGCPTLVKTVPMCIYKENKSETTKKKEDIAEFDGDDPIDTLRYALKRADKFVNESKHEFERYQKIDKAIGQFKKGGTYNDLDRALREGERTDKQWSGGLRRGDARKFLLNRTGGAPRRTRRSWALSRTS